jgi:gluconate 5-dehydrogenase
MSDESVPVRDLFSLAGKVALVTGASSGIGRAIAVAYAQAGAAVVLVARRGSQLQAATAAIEKDGGRAAHILCNLADRNALFDCAERAPEPFGAPDIVVNAAGINVRKAMHDVTPDDWDAVLKINLDASFFLPQRLAPAMIAKGWGRIVNIASLQSVRSFPNCVPYGASKGAIMQLTRAQAEAWSRHGICVNAIAPGFFPTELTAAVVNDRGRWNAMAEKTFIGRNGELGDLIGTAIFLASRASDYVTGQTIFVDGGFTAG